MDCEQRRQRFISCARNCAEVVVVVVVVSRPRRRHRSDPDVVNVHVNFTRRTFIMNYRILSAAPVHAVAISVPK